MSERPRDDDRARPLAADQGDRGRGAGRAAYDALPCGVTVLDADGIVVLANAAAAEILAVSRDRIEGHALTEVLAGAGWRAMREDGTPLSPAAFVSSLTRPQRAVVLGLTRPDGSARWLQVDARPHRGPDGRPLHVVASLVDATARTEALRQRERHLAAVEQLARRALEVSDVGTLLDVAAPLIAAALDVAYSAVWDYRPDAADGPALWLQAGAGWPDGVVGRASAGLERASQAGYTLLVREPVIVADLRTEARFAACPLLRAHRVVSGASVVIPGADREHPHGVVSAHATRPRRFTPADVSALQAIADMLAAAQRRQDAAEALRHQALHDAATGLPNRALFHDRLEQALRRAQRAPTPLALLLLDLDRFHEINDAVGHRGGDAVLRETAARLRGAQRAADTVARLGGDEFAVLLLDADEAAAAGTVRRLLDALEAPVCVAGQTLHIRASVGIALAPAHGADASALVRRADSALAAAKQERSPYAIYDAARERRRPDAPALGVELREAIARGGLLLHFQPLVALMSGRDLGVEALVRWPHPQRGLIPPDQFIPLAEQIGLIGPLTAWVLDAALRQRQTWQRDGLEVCVSVNLSMWNLRDPALPETVAGLLRRYEAPPTGLRLELTESSIMADTAQALASLARLRALGVRLAVDDFGTGYASLAYLKRLAVDELKIDRSFVQSMATDETNAIIVSSTIGLGHSLGLEVVAEGVETQAAWDLLVSWGCDRAQGYYLSRPLPAGEATEVLRERPWART